MTPLSPFNGSGLAAGYGAATQSPPLPSRGPGGLPPRPVYPLQSVTAGCGPTQAETAPLSATDRPRLFPPVLWKPESALVSVYLAAFRLGPLTHTHTQDGNLHSDRGLLVAGSSESRTDVSREHSQTALFTGQGLSHGPTKCKDTFRCTLTSNGPYNCWSSHISSTSAQYFPQRC